MRINRLLAYASLFILGMAGFFLPRPAHSKIVDEVAVVVDHDSMTRGELEEAIQAYFFSQFGPKFKIPAPQTPEFQTAKKEVVEAFIREVLLAEEADRTKIEVSDGEVDHEVNNEIDNMKKGYSDQEFSDELKKEGITVEDLKQDTHDKLLRRIKANRALRTKQQDLPTSAVVSDEAVSQYFNEHPQDYEQVKFDIILFRVGPKTKPEAVKEVEAQSREVLKELKGGADFAAYAKKYSEDQGSADKGGAVGTVFRTELEPKLAKGVFSIPEKGLGLVRADEGFYIVKVDFKGKADYASVAPDIKEHLRKEKQDSGLKDWFTSLKKKAYIVVDGKVVTTTGDESPAPSAKVNKAAPNSEADEASKTTGVEVKTNKPTATEPTEEVKESSKESVYPSLPPGDSFTLYFGGEGFFYGVQDLASYYPAGTKVTQTFPFGYGLNAGLDYSLDPTFQVGLMGELLRKWVESANTSDQWTEMAGGPALTLKLLIPLDESTNFTLCGAGGYYFLFGSSAVVSGNFTNLNGSNWGARAGGTLDFLLDDQKNTALELGGGYRYLKFNPTSVLNSDGSQAALDFSGPYVEAGLKFFLGKD